MSARLDAALTELVEALREEVRGAHAVELSAGPVDLLDVVTFARRAGIGRSTAWLQVTNGSIRSLKIRGRRLIPESELARLASSA